jgi:hypothetical protein
MAKKQHAESPSVTESHFSEMPEDLKLSISEGILPPVTMDMVYPYVPTEAITPESLQPGHFDELTALAQHCLLASDFVRKIAATLDETDDARWWFEHSLVNTLTSALRAERMLDAGLEREIIRAYPSCVIISAAGFTWNNAHRLATHNALHLVCEAWHAVYVAEGQEIGTRMSIMQRAPIGMRPTDEANFPLFKTEHLSAVARVINAQPCSNEFELQARIDWENAKVTERRLTAKKQIVEDGGFGSVPGQPTITYKDAREKILKQLEPAVRKAYLAYQYAETIKCQKLEDRAAYDWLKENGFDSEKDEFGELMDYKLPKNYETFRRYLTEARKPLDENKYIPRAGRWHGRSIVEKDEIEYQKDD